MNSNTDKFVLQETSPAGRRKGGFALFTMAAAMIGICGVAGLVKDAGYAELARRQAQVAAEAGAKAAALEISLGAQTSSLKAAALHYTSRNGFTNGVGNVTVTVNQPPASGPYASDRRYAEVIISQVISASFMSNLGFTPMKITASGVAGPGGAHPGDEPLELWRFHSQWERLP